MRLVLDTAVMVAALRSDAGASRKLLESVLSKRLALLISVPLMIEYEAVMTRPEHLAAAGWSESQVLDLLDVLADIAEQVTLAYLWRPLLQDADDNMVFETAMNGRADAIVTFNRRDFAPVGTRFGMPVLKPAEAWMQLEKQQ